MSEVHSEHPVGQVLPLIGGGKNTREVVGGVRVKVSGVRLMCFKHNQTCVSCNLTANTFAVERHTPHQGWHLNLYHIDADGKRVLFTRDHIIPRAKGGSESLKNQQTMCVNCNGEKGAKLTVEDVSKGQFRKDV